MSTHTATSGRPNRPEDPDEPHGTVNIFVNDVRHPVGRAALTGAEIAALGGIPAGNQLFLEVPGPGDDELVAPDRSLEVKSGMRFYDVPAGNLG